jgi:hypothetical protein
MKHLRLSILTFFLSSWALTQNHTQVAGPGQHILR